MLHPSRTMRTPLFPLLSLGALLLLGARDAQADPGGTARFANVVHGGIFDTSFGTSHAGDALMGELGGESLGLRTFGGRRWLFAWDVMVAAKAGWLGNQHPFLFLAGGHALAWMEGGARLTPARPWSVYLGGRLGGDVQLLAHPGLSFNAFDTINDASGVAPSPALGDVRLEGGASFLDRTSSWLLVLFVGEAMQAPEVITPGLAFTQVGVSARYDLTRSVIAEVEGAYGIAPTRTDPFLGLSDQTSRIGLSASVRKVFRNGMWLGVSSSVARDLDQISYPRGASFLTMTAPRFALTLLLGVPLWRQP